LIMHSAAARERIHALRENCRDFALELYDVDSPRQGIAHVIAPELGIALPGCRSRATPSSAGAVC
jgi:3-isopropylmalate/(R)-2-methylmalate dehydratase large subunit